MNTVKGPTPAMAKPTLLVPGVTFAAARTSRSEPGPASLVFVTSQEAPKHGVLSADSSPNSTALRFNSHIGHCCFVQAGRGKITRSSPNDYCANSIVVELLRFTRWIYMQST